MNFWCEYEDFELLSVETESYFFSCESTMPMYSACSLYVCCTVLYYAVAVSIAAVKAVLYSAVKCCTVLCIAVHCCTVPNGQS